MTTTWYNIIKERNPDAAAAAESEDVMRDTSRREVFLIEKALEVCADPEVSDAFKAGYCESCLTMLKESFEDLLDLYQELKALRDQKIQ